MRLWTLCLLACGENPGTESDSPLASDPPTETESDVPTDLPPTTDTPAPPPEPTEPWLAWAPEVDCVGTGLGTDDGDADPESITTTSLDVVGGAISLVRHYTEIPIADQIDVTSFVDVAGLHLPSRSEHTGPYLAVETWGYDDSGRMVAYTIDDGSDGVVDETWAHTWNGDDLVQSTLALGADPDVDIVYTGTYIDGRRQSWVADVGVDGDLDELWAHTWTGDHEHVEADLNGDGDIDRVEDRVWDGSRMTAVAVDATNDGAFEQITAWTYDADGRITSLIIEIITLPTTTTVTALTAFDVEGREVTYDYSFDALSDGLLEYVETRVTTWVCRP